MPFGSRSTWTSRSCRNHLGVGRPRRAGATVVPNRVQRPGVRSGAEELGRNDADSIRPTVGIGAGPHNDRVKQVGADVPASHRRCRTSPSPTLRPSFASIARIRPSPRSTTRSTSRSLDFVRRWKTRASRLVRERVRRASRAIRRGCRAGDRLAGPAGRRCHREVRRHPLRAVWRPAPDRRGDVWEAAPARAIRLRVGNQAGTGSKRKSRSSTSRYGWLVVRAGLSSWSLIAASRMVS